MHRYTNGIPWLGCGTCGDSQLLVHGNDALSQLALLLADIEGTLSEKDRIVKVFTPRPIVFHGQGDAVYLFRARSRYAFASFATDMEILTVLPRYNDPMDPKSGRRKSRKLLSGWQGVAEILESAVRLSPDWKNFQTIETYVTDPDGFDEGYRATYEVWASPRRNLKRQWCGQRNVRDGYLVMPQSKPVLLAKFGVNVRPQESGFTLEKVMDVTLYPQLAGKIVAYDECYMCGESEYDQLHNCEWRPVHDDNDETEYQCDRLSPIALDLSDEHEMRWMPHDEFKLALNLV